MAPSYSYQEQRITAQVLHDGVLSEVRYKKTRKVSSFTRKNALHGTEKQSAILWWFDGINYNGIIAILWWFDGIRIIMVL